MTQSTADNEFDHVARALGFDFNGEIKIGGHYAHTRTSVGDAQLPKGATVELDLMAAI